MTDMERRLTYEYLGDEREMWMNVGKEWGIDGLPGMYIECR